MLPGTLIRLQADRLPGDRGPKPVWLWSSRTGATPADVDRLWQAFLRGFDLETHVPAVQTDPRLDRSTAARPRRRGPVDLADYHHVHPATPRPAADRRPTPPLGTPHHTTPAHPGTGPPRVSQPPPENHPPGRCTKTQHTRPRTTPRLHKPPPGTPPRRRQNHQKRPEHHQTTKPQRLNKLRLRSVSWSVGRECHACSQDSLADGPRRPIPAVTRLSVPAAVILQRG